MGVYVNLIAVGDAPKKTRVQSPNNRERVPIMLNVGEVAGDCMLRKRLDQNAYKLSRVFYMRKVQKELSFDVLFNR